MSSDDSNWWTDEKVDATVTSQYVHSHLRPNEAEQLTKSVFGDLSDDTYLEWILTRSKRFFLTLVEAGVPDQIFGVIDDSFSDEDLPIPDDEVPALLLSAQPDRGLDRRFYRAQFKYLIRIVGDGEHIRYAREETVPVTPLGTRSLIGKSKDGLERVKLPSTSQRVFARKRIHLTNRFMEEELLAEVAEWRVFAHEHVLSIFGSYTADDHLSVLLTPPPDYSLKSFLNDTPKAFEALPKPERRKLTLLWTHCLANGLSWLHENGKHHGAIRPSRIGIDDRYRIYLGQFDGTGILCDGTVKDDIEAYQYAAPERWKRSVTIQATGNARTVLPSGGRTGRRLTSDPDRMMSTNKDEGRSSTSQKLNTARPTSVSYAFNPTSRSGTRLKLGMTKSAVSKMGGALRQTESRQTTHMNDGLRPTRTSIEAHARPGAASALSSDSSENARSHRQGGMIYAATPEMRTAVVQTWVSAQHDQLAADVFALGAIMMDIISFLCKHSSSSFARHRSSKNKSAGRGGGLADASFHANIGQIFSWAEMLQKDAEKKMKKDNDLVFKAIGPCLQVILQCLEREPSDRLNAQELQKKLCDHMRDFAGLNIAQCCLDSQNEKLERSHSRAASIDLLRQKASSRQQLHQTADGPKNRSDNHKSPKPLGSAFTPRIDSLRISPANLNTFQFDIDSTLQDQISSKDQGYPSLPPQTRPQQYTRPDSFAFATDDGVEVFPRPPGSAASPSSKSSQRRQNRHGMLWSTLEEGTPTSSSSGKTRTTNHTTAPSTANTFIPPSTAPSTVGTHHDDFHSVYSYTPPPTAQPTRELPPVPVPSNLKPNSGAPRSVKPTKTPPLPSLNPNPNISSESDSEPTALPSYPSIDKHAVNSTTNTHPSRSLSHQHKHRTHHRAPSTQASDIDELTPVSTHTVTQAQAQGYSEQDRERERARERDRDRAESTSSAAGRERFYRTPSRQGAHDGGRVYVGPATREKLGVRGLQFP